MIVQWKLTMTLKDLLTTCVWFSKYTYTCKQKILWGFYIKKYLKGLILFCSLVQCYLTLKINDFLDVTEMHKAEIAAENEELKHYVQCYDHMFERAHRRLSNLRQEYEESKQYLPPKRYPLLKEMVKTVIRDKKLMPDGFDD